MMRWVGAISFALLIVLFAGASRAESVAHHTAKVRIDPASSRIAVHDLIQFDGVGITIFTLAPTFTVDSVKVDGKSIAAQKAGRDLTVDVGAQGRHTLELSYQGEGAPVLGAQGGFVDADWLAQPEGALATWTVEGRTPHGQKFVLPGRLTFETEQNGAYSATFENTTPTAPPVLITGPFSVAEKMANGVRLRTYFHDELSPLAQTYLDDTARYISYYVGRIGPYPYPGFSIVSGPAPVGWGLPGMTYMGRRVLALPFIRFTSLPHEILHNWWGNAVEVDYENGNWAEGLTTYQADHAMAEAAREVRGGNGGGGRAKRLEWLRNYAALPPERDHALTAFRSKTHDASQVVGYGKTAFVFHMLKTQLGATTFDKALQRFNRDNHGKVAGWPEIQAAFEAQSGQSLAPFFTAWVERPGAPELALSEVKMDGAKVSFTLHQIQDGPAYPLTLPLTLKTTGGTERHTIRLTRAAHTYKLITKGKAKPIALRIDPDFDVFRRLDNAQTPPILRDVTLDPGAQLVALGSIALRDQAHDLAGGLLQTRLRLLDNAQGAKTVIIAGPRTLVRAHLAAAGWPPAPSEVAKRGDARAWTARTQSGQTLLMVEAEDSAGFAALNRVLPHYKGRSYVIVENGKTADKGTWPPGDGPLTVRFD